MDVGVWVIGGGLALGLVLGVLREFDRGEPSAAAPRGRRRAFVDPDERTRKVIEESLDIATKTKRRATAESRLQVAEDALDDLVRQGKEIADDQINRHTLSRLREGLDRRFPGVGKKK